MQPDGAVTIIEITVIRSRELFAFEVKSSITTMIQHFIYLFCEILTKFAQYYLSLQQSLPS